MVRYLEGGEGRAFPVLICNTCGEPILRAGEGMAVLMHPSKEPGACRFPEVRFVHKKFLNPKCDHYYDTNDDNGSYEIFEWVSILCRLYGVDPVKPLYNDQDLGIPPEEINKFLNRPDPTVAIP